MATASERKENNLSERDIYPVDVARRTWNLQDRHGQILALAFRQKSLNGFRGGTRARVIEALGQGVADRRHGKGGAIALLSQVVLPRRCPCCTVQGFI